MEIAVSEALALFQKYDKITFLTGAGVSTPSGIPDYRSLKGVYHGLEQPEYLLSHTCMEREPEKFYDFVKKLYHPQAKPNLIHQKMADLALKKSVWIVSQNIDGLHKKAGSQQCVDFHGTLYQCYCRKCHQEVSATEYLQSDCHQNCGGQIRPNIVLYEEGFSEDVLNQATKAVEQAELIVIVGTSFQVHPFCDLIHYRKNAEILVINQTPIYVPYMHHNLCMDATEFFKQLSIK